jgi:hypothetical protein
MEELVDTQAEQVLRRFELLPQRYAGRRLFSKLKMTSTCTDPWPSNVQALGLPLGETVECYVETPAGIMKLYAVGDIAEQVLDLPEGTVLHAVVETRFGIGKQVEWTEKGPLTKRLRASPCGAQTGRTPSQEDRVIIRDEYLSARIRVVPRRLARVNGRDSGPRWRVEPCSARPESRL